MWNKRYETAEYIFGKEPAIFMTKKARYLKPGQSALAVADGEGRNSVFMAQKGVKVTAMDSSTNAVAKAKLLAAERGVNVDFNVADILKWEWVENRFDLVAAVFIQFVGPAQRAEIFDGIKRTLKPGGILMLHGYTPEQIDLGIGGPPFVENMYRADLLAQNFADFEIVELNTYHREVQEGRGHSGMSALVDLIARKK